MSSLLSKIIACIVRKIKCTCQDVGEVCRLYEGNENVEKRREEMTEDGRIILI
jgi:hypothetical protein